MRYESQVFTAVLSEQLSKEGRELKREDSLYTGGQHVLCFIPGIPGIKPHDHSTRDLPLIPPTP